jgi:16S rRNA (cytosine1402-N4)-methyltransferase
VNGAAFHEPVLVEASLAHWVVDPAGVYVDGTVGGGGHAHAMLARFQRARLIGLDRDPAALEAAAARLRPFADRVRLVASDFADLESVLSEADRPQVQGIVLDLGVSSRQIEDPARGFSYLHDGPLRMTLDREAAQGVGDLLAAIEEGALKRIFAELGELPGAGRAARAVIEARGRGPLRTTGDLVRALARGGVTSPRRLSQASQALRFSVNGELESLDRGLAAAARVLPAGGTLTLISFESLMDRRVKQAFHPPRRERPHPGLPEPDAVWERLTRRAVRPDPQETARNPRARSARLRAARRRPHA